MSTRDREEDYELQRQAYYDALIDAHNAKVEAQRFNQAASALFSVLLGLYIVLCFAIPQFFTWPFLVLWFIVHPFLWAVDMLLQGYSSHELFVIPDWLRRNL